MPQVLFLETRVVQDENRSDLRNRTVYEAGEIYNLPQASIDRWVRRGVATEDKDQIRNAKRRLEREEEKEEEEEAETKATETKATETKASETKTTETTARSAVATEVSTKAPETKTPETTISGARSAPNALTSKEAGLTPSTSTSSGSSSSGSKR